MIDGYIPKQNLEAEQAVLGAVLRESDTLAGLDLSPDDFYRNGHRLIFDSMVSLYRKSEPVDLLSLNKVLTARGQLEEVGGISYISALFDAVPTAANARYHSKLIKGAAGARRLQTMCLQTLAELQAERYESIDELVAKINGALSEVLKFRGGEVVSMMTVAKDIAEYVEQRVRHRHEISGIPSGFKDLDEITDGFQDGDLIILAARPGMGKSAFAMAAAQNAAALGYPIGVISLEMVKGQIGIRSLATMAEMDLFKLRKGIISREEMPFVLQAASRMAELPIYFSFSSWDLTDIQRTISQMVQRYGVKMVIVDYLQLAKNAAQRGTQRGTREREIGEISTALKTLAKSFTIPIMALSQLNRDVEKREEKRPRLSDLRDSGQIEQDADVIIFLYRENISEPRGIVEVSFGKGRNIGLGKVKLKFDGDKMKFADHRVEGWTGIRECL